MKRTGLWTARAAVGMCVYILAAGNALAVVFPDPSIPQNSRLGSDLTHGLKRAIYFVVHDEDDPFTTSQWNSRVNSIRSKENQFRDFYAGNSGGEFDIYWGDILDVPIPLNADGTRPSGYQNLVRSYATSQGYNLNDYFMYSYDVSNTTPDPGQGWGGLSTSGSSIYLQSTSVGTTTHEIGHQIGIGHSKALDTRNDSSYHAYTYDTITEQYEPYSDGPQAFNAVPFGVANFEYGNPFDVMGSSSSMGDFQIRSKLERGWISSSQIETVTTEGTYRIYAHDELQAITNQDGDYGVQEGYNPSVNYGLTYSRLGQRFSTINSTFVNDTQQIDIEYRSGADGAFFYLKVDGTDNGSGEERTLIDLDPSNSSRERLLEVGRGIEDTQMGLSTFVVDAGAVNQSTPDFDFLSYDPPAPTLRASSWFHIEALNVGVDSIGSYIDLQFSVVSPLNEIDGDLNQDGLFNGADFDLFLAGWRTDTSAMSSVESYYHGDMNFDGITDLNDAFLFRQALIAAGSPELAQGLPAQAPEPGSLLLLMSLVAVGVLKRPC